MLVTIGALRVGQESISWSHWGLNATTTATKTALENTSSCYLYDFAIISIRSTSTMSRLILETDNSSGRIIRLVV